jgi:rhodanese-related sulfurtransferase
MHMKNRFFCILTAALFFLACNSNAQNVDANVFEQKINAGGVQVLDVRTAGEYNGSHLKNVMLADWTNKAQFEERVKYLDKNKTLLVYCAAGGRSGQAAVWLKEQGFKEVVNLQGGITAWNAAGKPVVREGGAVELSTAAFNATIASSGIVLVDIGAAWCPPCKKMEPVLDAFMKQDNKKLTLVKMDGGIETALMKSLKVEALPTFILYKNGKEVKRKQGLVTQEEFNSWLK